MLSFSKSLHFKMLFVHTKTHNRRFQISQGLKSVFEKFRFRVVSVWTVFVTVEIKLRF